MTCNKRKLLFQPVKKLKWIIKRVRGEFYDARKMYS